MPGAVMDLLAYGTQNLSLSGNPDITYWSMSYKQYTNFAVESIEVSFNGQADFGRRVSAILSRNGDLAYRTYLQVTLPEIGQGLAQNNGGVYARWLDFIGEQLISMVEIDIGGQRIDRHYGDFMHIWNQLTLNAEAKKKYYKMIGHTTQLTYLIDPNFADINGPCTGASSGPAQVCAPRKALPETTLYIPLLFWFCKNPGLALPLLALQFAEVKITVDFRPLAECLWAVKSLTETAGIQTAPLAYQVSLSSASLYVDYVFLDIDERTKLAAEPADYLITQLLYPGEEAVGSATARVKLNLNHPVKEVIWVVQPDANVDYCGSMIGGNTLYKLLGAQPFNYTDALDALPRSIAAFGSQAAVTGAAGQGGTAFINASGLFEQPGAQVAVGGTQWQSGTFPQQPFAGAGQAGTVGLAESTVSDAGTFVLAETARGLNCYGSNPVVVAKIQMNGGDRFSEREGSYFDQVQPFQHHTGAGETGINVYSFALKPEDDQPSGTCNFSRIDNATLQMVLSANAVQGTATAKVRYYANNINSLRVTGGLAGPAWAA